MNVIQKLTGWFSAYAMLILASFILLITAGNEVGASSLTASHPFWWNVFFVNYTVFGNGIFVVCLALAFIFYLGKRQKGYSLLFAAGLSFLFIQLLKNIFYGGAATVHLEANQYLFFRNAGLLNNPSTLISGYTVMVFSLATVLVFHSRYRFSFLLFLPMAVLVAYSRMYLANNTLLEVLLSSLVGIISGTSAVYLSLYGTRLSRSFAKMHKLKNQNKSTAGQVVHPA